MGEITPIWISFFHHFWCNSRESVFAEMEMGSDQRIHSCAYLDKSSKLVAWLLFRRGCQKLGPNSWTTGQMLFSETNTAWISSQRVVLYFLMLPCFVVTLTFAGFWGKAFNQAGPQKWDVAFQRASYSKNNLPLGFGDQSPRVVSELGRIVMFSSKSHNFVENLDFVNADWLRSIQTVQNVNRKEVHLQKAVYPKLFWLSRY